MLWILGGAFNNRTLRHVSDVRSACAGTDRFDHRPRSRAAVCLQLTADMDSRSHHRRYRPDACRNHGRCHCAEQRKAERHGDESSAHHRVRLILPGIRRIAHSDLHNACISAQQQNNILLAVLAFLTLVVWIPGIKRRSGVFRMEDPTSSDQESCRTTCRAACPDATPASAQRRRPARRRNRNRHGCGSRLFRYSRCHGRRLQSAAHRSARRP